MNHFAGLLDTTSLISGPMAMAEIVDRMQKVQEVVEGYYDSLYSAAAALVAIDNILKGHRG